MLSSLRTQDLGQAEEIIHFPQFYSEKQYFPRFSTQYSIESMISRGRFFPVLLLLSSGSRLLLVELLSGAVNSISVAEAHTIQSRRIENGLDFARKSMIDGKIRMT